MKLHIAHIALTCIFALMLVQGDAQTNVIKKTTSVKEAVLENAYIKAVFTIGSDQRLHEKYYTRRNDHWELVLSEFNPVYKKSDSSDTQLWNTRYNPYRFLIASLKASSLQKENDSLSQKVTINLKSGKNIFTQTVILQAKDSYFHIEVSGSLAGEVPQLDYLLSAYQFQYKGVPDFVHTPGLKFDDPRTGKGKDQILGDRAFHSPAVVLQQGSQFAALVPDLNLINKAKVLADNARQIAYKPIADFYIREPLDRISMPVGIDLNVHSKLSSGYPVITYGLMDYITGYHTRFVRKEKDSKMVRQLHNHTIAYGFDLLLHMTSDTANGYMLASQHLWKQFGEQAYNASAQLVMPYADYVRLVQRKIFYPIRDKDGKLYTIPGGTIDPPVDGYEDHGSWLEWNDGKERIGGFRCSAPFWSDVINNSVFWNQARDAVGMYYWSKELKDSFLLQKARMMIGFCLKAPRNEQGLFSTVFNAKDKTWGIGWSDPPHGENRLFMRDAKSYEIPAICKTGAHLLDYYLRAEKDERIIDYLRPFANWLLTVTDSRGIVPSYVTTEMKTSDILYESAQPAAALWFLAQMYNATKEVKYLEGAVKIAAYIEKEIIPTAKWIDMEQYVSCGQKPFSMVKDDWQGQWFRGNLCIMWACEGFAALHQATNDSSWLQSGEKCIDYLSFTQACWSPHFVYTSNPFGGFGTDNGDDAALMDQRQEEFVKSYIYYGLQLHRSDLLQRGVAAGRSGCLLINHERHIKNNITPSPRHYPEGFAPENIDHEGISQWPMRTHPLWGEGIAVFTGLSEIRRALGGLYIDADHHIIIASDGVKITSVDNAAIHTANFLSRKYLLFPYEKDYSIDVIVEKNKQRVLLNDQSLPQGKTTLILKAEN